MRANWLRSLFRRPSEAASRATRARAEGGEGQAQRGMAGGGPPQDGGALGRMGAAGCPRPAAEQNQPQAQFDLGVRCAEGRGVPCDETAALQWFRKAAEQGHAAAQYQVGVRCRRATFGRPRLETAESRIEAYKWFRLAAAQGNQEAAAAWEQMAMDLSPAEVSEGNRRATLAE